MGCFQKRLNWYPYNKREEHQLPGTLGRGQCTREPKLTIWKDLHGNYKNLVSPESK